MRTRNIKINVYLNEEEKKVLEEKSTKGKLSQSNFLRNLINNYYPSKLTETDIKNVVDSLSKLIDNLSMLKNQMDFLEYADYSKFIAIQNNNIKDVISKIQK